MRGGHGLKGHVIFMNLCMVVPVLLLFSVTALTTVYTQARTAAIELLTNESYGSQIYLMEQLSGRRGFAEQERELFAAAPAFCKTLSDSLGFRVQIYGRDGTPVGDSSITRGLPSTEDVERAVGGMKAYTFVQLDGRSGVSFSSPIYSGEHALGAVRYLAPVETSGLIPRLMLVLCCFCIVATLLCYVVSSLVAAEAVRPAERLTRAVERLGRDPDAKLDPKKYEAEFQSLAAAFAALKQSSDQSLEQLRLEKEKQNLFFNSATHQLKTPLTSIIGYSDIIRRMSADEDVRQSAGYIESAGRSLLQVVEQIIDISRFQKSEIEFNPTWFSLDELCAECAKLLHPRLERNGITLANSCAPIQVYFDRARVRETLLNLLDNCILHSGCTRISISTDIRPVRMYVQDNGHGIEKTQLEHLFEPFFRPAKSQAGGSGLGLSICKGSMTAQGGDVEMEAAPGGGTRAILYFGDKTRVGSGFQNMRRRI